MSDTSELPELNADTHDAPRAPTPAKMPLWFKLSGLACVGILVAIILFVFRGNPPATTSDPLVQPLLSMADTAIDLDNPLALGAPVSPVKAPVNDTLEPDEIEVTPVTPPVAIQSVLNELDAITQLINTNDALLQAQLQQHANLQKELSMRLDVVSKEVSDEILGLKEAQSQLLDQLKQLQEVATKPKVTPKPTSKPVYHPKLSANVVAIDIWDEQFYVVISDQSGAFVYLKKGDIYQGWTLTAADAKANKATFKKGWQTVSIQAKG